MVKLIAVLTLAVIFSLTLNIKVHSRNVIAKVIKDPKPNMVEKEYVELEKLKSISEDLGNGEYLFSPSSLTLGSDDRLYVYDGAQDKIFIFNKELQVLKSFGRKGSGPGEFLGNNLLKMGCYIRMGRDGKLYVYDRFAKKILIFSKEGEYIRDIRFPSWKFYDRFDKPPVDFRGEIFIPVIEEGDISLFNKNFSKIMKLTNEEENLTFLLYGKNLHPKIKIRQKNWLLDITIDSRLLVYFYFSSTLYVVKNEKVQNKFVVRPTDALADYKKRYALLRKKDKTINSSRAGVKMLGPSMLIFFTSFFVDEDDKDVFYLQYPLNETKGIFPLYRLNLAGELMRVFYIEKDKNYIFFPEFQSVKNKIFYSIDDESEGKKVSIYKIKGVKQ
jgi:hypothetical protein